MYQEIRKTNSENASVRFKYTDSLTPRVINWLPNARNAQSLMVNCFHNCEIRDVIISRYDIPIKILFNTYAYTKIRPFNKIVENSVFNIRSILS